MDTDERIREEIERALEHKGWGYADLARAMGVTRSHTQQIVSGRRGKIPKSLIDTLEALGLELCVREKC